MDFSSELREAAVALGIELQTLPAAFSIGIGEEKGRPIFLMYTSRRLSRSESSSVPPEWRKIPVHMQVLGKLKPAVEKR